MAFILCGNGRWLESALAEGASGFLLRWGKGVAARMALVLALLSAFLTTGALGGNPRLAVLSAPELEKEALLLTTALSSNENLEMLERAEIVKLLQEQRLGQQGLTMEDGTRLGGLLKAEGLVLLEQGASGELRLRVVAVDSGAVLGFSSAPLPLVQAERWSALQAAEIARLAPKLKIPRGEAIPISFLRINSAHGGAHGAVLEENVGSLLAKRLSVAPKIIVLERARLQDAVLEKEFGGAERSAFQTSGWVLDGTVAETPSGFSLDLRLQPPDGRAAQRVEAQGRDITTLVEAANDTILQAVGGGSSPEWDANAEARRFGDEALWAADNGLWEQAARAIEAAIALGETSPEALRWRWQCYHRLARNLPGPKATSKFHNAEGKERPGASQMEQMTRSLELYHEALMADQLPADRAAQEPRSQPRGLRRRGALPFPNAGGGHRKGRFAKTPMPSPSGGGGGLPDSEGGSLLRAASQLIFAVEKPHSALDAAHAQALAGLRSEIHAVFDKMVSTIPELALLPAKEDRVPDWNPQMDPHTTGSREAPLPQNLHHIRLLYGRTWEAEPKGYFAYVKQCLESDLAADPHFYQRAVHFLTERGPSHGWVPRKKADAEKRKAGAALAAEKSLRCQVGGAFLLCQSGALAQGLQVFERHKESLWDGRLPASYLVGAFRFNAFTESRVEGEGESISRATGSFKELLTALLERDLPLTTDMLYALGRIPFTERQSMELLTPLRAYLERHPSSSKDSREGAANALLASLSRRARLAGQETGAPPAAARLSPLPERQPQKEQPGAQPLLIEQGWLARNYDDADKPGAIRHALPAGGKIWLHVEYPQRQSGAIRRQFMTLDLPSLESRVVHRDTLPAAFAAADRVGPSFVFDGEGLYFWNGRGIRCVRGKEIRDLEVPELKRPFLWLVEGDLYAADEEGVLMKIDRASGHYEIVASLRRRPARNALDEERDLRKITRVFRRADGALAVKVGSRKLYVSDAAGLEWKAASPMTLPDLLGVVEKAWDEAESPFMGTQVDELLRKRGSAQRGSPRSRMTLAHYLPAEERSNPRALRTASVQSGVVSEGVLWSFLSELDRLCLLRLDLSSDAFVSRAVEFSPEHEPSILATSRRGSYRLIPTPAGLGVYTPNEPVFWLVPQGSLPPLSKNFSSSSHD